MSVAGADTLDRSVAGRLALWGILVAAYLASVISGLSRSLGIDEVWVANSILASSWKDCLYHGTWIQSTPPGFLAVVRGITSLLPPSNVAFHIFGLSLGLASLLLFARVTSTSFSFPVSYLATALFAFSPTFLQYSDTLKQYIAEVFFCCLMLAASRAFEVSQARWLWLWCTMAVCSLAFAYGTIFVIAGFIVSYGAVLLTSQSGSPTTSLPSRIRNILTGPESRGFRNLLIFSGVVGATLVTLYVLCIRPNTSPALYRYWKSEYGLRPTQLLRGLYELLLRLCEYLPTASYVLTQRLGRVLVLTLSALAIGVGLTLWARRGFATAPRILGAVVVIAALMCSSLFSLYPFEARTGLFVLPLFVYLVAVLVQAFRSSLATLRAKYIPFAFDTLCLLLGVFAGITACYSQIFNHADAVGFQSACRYFRRSGSADDFLYVHASAREGFKLYSKLDGPVLMRTALGDSAYPCCVRGQEWPLGVDPSRARRDLLEKLPVDFRQKVFLIHAGWLGFWKKIGQNEYQIQTEALISLGCRFVSASPPGAVMVSSFDCSARP